MKRLGFLAVTCAALLQVETRAEDRECQPRVLAEFDVFGDGDKLLIPVRVDDITCTFVLDTGCAMLVFDQSLAAHLAPPEGTLPLIAFSAAKEVTLHQPPRNIWIGKLPLHSRLPVASTDLNGIREASGQDILGVLGMGALWDKVIQVNFDQGKVTFLSAPQPNDDAERLYLHCSHGTPHVAAKSILGRQSWAVDTGHTCLNSLNVSSVDFMLLQRKRGGRSLGTSFSTDVTGTVTTRAAFFGDVALNRSCVSNLIAEEHSYYDGNVLGLGFWSRFNITFDFPNSVMYVVPNRSFRRADQADLSGARIVRRAGKIVVDRLFDGGVASSAGLRAGDTIVSVGAEDAAKLRLFTLSRLLATPNTTVELVVLRNSSPLKIDMRLPATRETAMPAMPISN